ncbi:MAG TPA: hypothetical protein VJL84_04755 [Kiloniellales bacterium]|nr:hypothetical protein [Kiloniellales bacterium]
MLSLGLLGGCVAIPPAVAIASYVIDVGSFVATGKTATDHAISAVAQQDCAIMRIFEGNLCIDEPDYQLASAGVLEPLPPEGQLEPPLALTPLASGDFAALPQIARLPDAALHVAGGQLAAGPISRDSVLSGATYLAEGLIYPTLGGSGG